MKHFAESPYDLFKLMIRPDALGAIFSKQKIKEIPKFFGNIEIDMETALDLCREIKKAGSSRLSPSLPFAEFIFGYTCNIPLVSNGVDAMVCAYVKEISPNEYEYYCMRMPSVDEPEKLFISKHMMNTIETEESKQTLHDHTRDVVYCFSKKIQEALKNRETGVIPPTSERIKKAGDKKDAYSQDLENIFILGKDYKFNFKGVSNKDIVWHHSWSSMGHWRTLNSDERIGKDRAGVYHIQGATWVNESVKGDGPLKASTRIIT